MKVLKNKIAKQTLKLLINNTWESISIDMIIKKMKLDKKEIQNNFKNKDDLLKNINQYFDYLILKSAKSIEKSTPRDMLFEILMKRFDLLTSYRPSILKIYENFKYQPKNFIILLPTFIQSISVMANSATINTKGFSGSIKIKSILVIYFSTFFTWLNDDNPALEKTMTVLNNYLERLEKLVNLVNN